MEDFAFISFYTCVFNGRPYSVARRAFLFSWLGIVDDGSGPYHDCLERGH